MYWTFIFISSLTFKRLYCLININELHDNNVTSVSDPEEYFTFLRTWTKAMLTSTRAKRIPRQSHGPNPKDKKPILLLSEAFVANLKFSGKQAKNNDYEKLINCISMLYIQNYRTFLLSPCYVIIWRMEHQDGCLDAEQTIRSQFFFWSSWCPRQCLVSFLAKIIFRIFN